MNSAAGAPAAATSTPAIAGPSMNVAEKAMFRVAFACRSAACVNASRSFCRGRARIPLDLRLLARRPRRLGAQQRARGQRRRAVERRQDQDRGQPEVPQQHRQHRVVTTPSNRYSPLSTPRRREASTRAASAGAANAGSAWPEISSAATATALCVWSKTATDSATKPNQVPSRLTV